YVRAHAHYTWGPSDVRETEEMKRFAPTVTLTGPGLNQALIPLRDWKPSGSGRYGEFVLPQLNDGDYVLHVEAKSSVGDSSVDLPLPLYAPARVHLITDRPLYEPG